MMGPGMFDNVIRDLVVIVAVVVSLIWLVLFFAVPWLWNLLKPWIHAVTA